MTATSTTKFNGDASLSTADDYYNGKGLTFTTGALIGQTATVGLRRRHRHLHRGAAPSLPRRPRATLPGGERRHGPLAVRRPTRATTRRRSSSGWTTRSSCNDLPGNPVTDTPPDEVIPIPFRARSGAADCRPAYAIAIFDEGDGTVGSTPPQIPLGFATSAAT